MKKRILEFLIKIGKKCKPLTYPVICSHCLFDNLSCDKKSIYKKGE